MILKIYLLIGIVYSLSVVIRIFATEKGKEYFENSMEDFEDISFWKKIVLVILTSIIFICMWPYMFYLFLKELWGRG